jgi:hypothetical protein
MQGAKKYVKVALFSQIGREIFLGKCINTPPQVIVQYPLHNNVGKAINDIKLPELIHQSIGHGPTCSSLLKPPCVTPPHPKWLVRAHSVREAFITSIT